MKIWKRVGGGWYGYGNGFKAALYESLLTERVKTLIYKGDHLVEEGHWSPNVETAKRWAERNYLKGTK